MLDWFAKRTELNPDKGAVTDLGRKREWTFRELDQRISAAARFLFSLGVQKGDRVALLAPNDIVYFDLLFACSRIGAIFVPLNWRLSAAELHYILSDCTPKVLGYHPRFEGLVAQLKQPSVRLFNTAADEHLSSADTTECAESTFLAENDPLAIIYTGGTTGKPKGVVLSHRSIFWNGLNTVLSWSLNGDDVTLTYLPMFHTGGLNALSLPVLMAGGKVVIGGEFDASEAAVLLNEYKCTIVLLVPTMYQRLITAEEFQMSDFPSMKIFLSGGAPCPLPIYDAFYKKGLKFKEGYGLTEAGPNNFYISPEDAMLKKGSVGKPMLFNEVKIVREDGKEAGVNEPGELLIRGKHTFEYYWSNEKATDEALKDGWLYTGDMARKDEDGYFYIAGRKKEMIISGAENVYPLEIEHWLASHPDVSETAVVGLADEEWGEKVVAFIVKKRKSLSQEELKDYCSRKLAGYKIPKVFFFVEELPKTDVGKIDKKELKKMGETLVKIKTE